MLLCGLGVLAEHTLHGGRRNAMALGDLSEGKLEWVSPSYRTENTSRAHAGNRRFPCAENSLIPPQLTGQFNWPKTGCNRRETRVSLRSIGTYDVKVRLIFASAPDLV
jgi:hypothetical protein